MNAENPVISEDTSTNAAASLLVVLPQLAPGIDLTAKIYGIPIARRIALSAKSAGFDRVLLLTADDRIAETAGLLENTPAIAISPENASAHLNARRIVILPANVLPDRKWLKSLREHQTSVGSMVFDAQRAAVIEVEPDNETVSQSIAGGGSPFAKLQKTLATETIDLSGPGSLVLQQTTTESDIEDWLRSCLVKDTDGFLARIIARPNFAGDYATSD